MLTLPYSYNWQKFNIKMNQKEARSIRVSTLNKYVTKQIISNIQELLLDNFVV